MSSVLVNAPKFPIGCSGHPSQTLPHSHSFNSMCICGNIFSLIQSQRFASSHRSSHDDMVDVLRASPFPHSAGTTCPSSNGLRGIEEALSTSVAFAHIPKHVVPLVTFCVSAHGPEFWRLKACHNRFGPESQRQGHRRIDTIKQMNRIEVSYRAWSAAHGYQ